MTAPALKLRVRSFRFDRVASYWLDGDPWRTRFFDAFSSVLPVGERFFIEAMRRAAAELKDPAVDELVTAFAQQEGVHGREHRRYNDRLRALGYALDAWDASQKRVMWKILAARDVRVPLAVTVGLEHLTASLGKAILAASEGGTRADAGVLAGADPEMLAFWAWHSAEEIEHKGVAFDVYGQLGGGPHLRRAVMAWCLFILAVRVAARLTHMLRAEGKLLERTTWRSAARALFGRGGLAAAVAPPLAAYFRRDFHPWQDDDYALVERWEAASSSESGRRPATTVASTSGASSNGADAQSAPSTAAVRRPARHTNV